MQDLVDECSANVTGEVFCNTCVRPLTRAELRAYLSGMNTDTVPDDLSAAAQVRRLRCIASTCPSIFRVSCSSMNHTTRKIPTSSIINRRSKCSIVHCMHTFHDARNNKIMVRFRLCAVAGFPSLARWALARLLLKQHTCHKVNFPSVHTLHACAPQNYCAQGRPRVSPAGCLLVATWVGWRTWQVAVYDRIGEQVLSFLEEEGMPVDDFFYANVVFCSLHTEDPVSCLFSALKKP